MKVHFCPLNKTCRENGAPARLHVTTRKNFYTLALTRNARVQKTGTHWKDGIWVRFDRRPLK